jgi:hypothetical protein
MVAGADADTDADLLWEKNNVEWLADSADKFKRTGWLY